MQPSVVTLLCQESLRKVDPFFEFANPLLQLIYLTNTGLKIVHRLAIALLEYAGLGWR
ncbi:MAG: hypothetical protein ACHP7P_14300 [Terriglobales bacterium]